MNQGVIVGIDLGTTNSEVAVVKNGAIKILEENGKATFPSFIGLDADGELLVGQEARNQYAARPEQTIRSIKRKMGTPEKIPLGDQSFTPPELSAMILTALKQRAEKELGQAVERAVITVPAYFNDAQRNATREAGELAGFKVERILNEPTAAAFAYELDHREQKTKTILVYDLGGGTFDVSILRMENDVVEVLATHGNTHLGGDDFDQQILERALAAFAEQHPKTEITSAGKVRMLLDCEQLKIALTDQAAASLINMAVPLEDGTTRAFEWHVTRREFEEWAEELYTSTLDSVHTALSAASLKAHMLDEIILVGGSTRTPLVADLLERELGLKPRGDIHPELAVAYGAGVMAARLMGEGGHRILVDITPYTFGIATLDPNPFSFREGLAFSRIIHAGTPLPCSRGQSYYTATPGQERCQIEVYQGEDECVENNTLVGEFYVEGLDKKAPANSEALVTMKLDLDGILTVTAVERHTGLQKTVVMKNAFGELSKTDLAQAREKVASLFKRKEQPDLAVVEGEAHTPPDHKHPWVEELEHRLNRCRERLDDADVVEIESLLAQMAERAQANDEAGMASAKDKIEDILYFAESGQ